MCGGGYKAGELDSKWEMRQAQSLPAGPQAAEKSPGPRMEQAHAKVSGLPWPSVEQLLFPGEGPLMLIRPEWGSQDWSLQGSPSRPLHLPPSSTTQLASV